MKTILTVIALLLGISLNASAQIEIKSSPYELMSKTSGSSASRAKIELNKDKGYYVFSYRNAAFKYNIEMGVMILYYSDKDMIDLENALLSILGNEDLSFKLDEYNVSGSKIGKPVAFFYKNKYNYFYLTESDIKALFKPFHR